jgi:hypothetical protein
MVKHSTLAAFLVLLFISLGMMLVSIYNLKEAVEIQASENYRLISEGKAITALKDKWDNKKAVKNTIKELRTLPKLAHYTRKESRYVLDFSGLNPDELNNLSNKLFNSNVVIKVYELKRLDSANGSVHVEIEI